MLAPDVTPSSEVDVRPMSLALLFKPRESLTDAERQFVDDLQAQCESDHDDGGYRPAA
jgi:hypothetical protein